ncbi:MAG: flagellar assembly peptidoglycan hydrolase FlgJ [Pseudolabrys sp.]|nr:flagellar assembly peptidoglycan hydrolase FlgJ [Pseudolabrys sp.]MBV9953990.1 flagellar assembly peptidoglycan hydrolase FlgJ [Pseudolabrys sp.]
MAGAMGITVPGIGATDALQMAAPAASQLKAGVTPAKAKALAQDFEAVFLNTMFSQMFTGIDGDGPFGGSKSTGVWRSFLTDEYSKSFAKAGGIGLADHVYAALIKQQEAKPVGTLP